MEFVISIVVLWALVFTMLTPTVADTLMANTDVEPVSCTVLAARMATSADGLPSQSLQVSGLLVDNPFIKVSDGTRFIFFQAVLDLEIPVDDSFLARRTSPLSNGVLRTRTSIHAVLVTQLAISVVIVLCIRTGSQTKRSILHVLAAIAVVGVRTVTTAITFFVTVIALFRTLHIDARMVAVVDTPVPQLEIPAGEAIVVPSAPASLITALLMADKVLLDALLTVSVVLHQRYRHRLGIAVVARELLPVDLVRETEVLVFQDTDFTSSNPLQRPQVEASE